MNDYTLRRTVLEAVRQAEPAPATFEDVCQFPTLEMTPSATPNTIGAVLGELVRRGYLQDMRPARAPLYRLTAAGADQLDRQADLDEYVWGEMASRFQ